ncbi:decaprenyl-phosphate phosphoribosyltransferase [Adlercreutzia sp. ZJ154]|uniref:decaprenyl-phosphate phosphoribosyltransferase n=1 Tax=Adlercreutzia sp. ZJ154 TaxID=2709790 RepID=UPI0013ECFA92|nr:decaprenyl-phosphate phosphoribosyltransferase [Adlercreutzia sp. ZJ154]
MCEWLKLLRVKHWLKNLLVLFPLLFSGRAVQPDALIQGIVAFLAFCFMASAIYVVNDIRDAENDRAHPTKCLRPIASGAISTAPAIVVACVFAVLAVVLCIPCAQQTPLAILFLIAYAVLNIAYSFGCKNVPILDIAMLSVGFLLRILFGSAFCGIEVSSWLFLTVLSLSVFLSLGKRRGEIERFGTSARASLMRYDKSFLDKNMYVYLGLGLVFYSLWTFQGMDVAYLGYSIGQLALVAGIPLAMFACMRYSFCIERTASDGDPIGVVLGDKPLLVLMILWVVVMIIGVYMP